MADEMKFNDLKAKYEYYKMKCIRLQEELAVLKKEVSDMKFSSKTCKIPEPKHSYDRPDSASRSFARDALSSASVRGKKRKQLPGFTCEQCTNFYKAAGIDDQGIQQCTRHRGVKRPKTPPGYWNIGWNSPEKQDTFK